MPKKQDSAASPAVAVVTERQLAAMHLRKQGGTYRQIASQMRTQPGVSARYNEAQAYRDVMGALDYMRQQLKEEAESYRMLELERIDEMFSALWSYAKQGDIASVDRIVKLMEMRAKYMPGLQVPPKDAGPRGASVSVGLTNGSGGNPVITEVVIELHPEAPEQLEPIDGEGVSS